MGKVKRIIYAPIGTKSCQIARSIPIQVTAHQLIENTWNLDPCL